MGKFKLRVTQASCSPKPAPGTQHLPTFALSAGASAALTWLAVLRHRGLPGLRGWVRASNTCRAAMVKGPSTLKIILRLQMQTDE